VVSGRVERNSTVLVQLDDTLGAPVTSQVTWQVSPASDATLSAASPGADSVLLLRDTVIALTARALVGSDSLIVTRSLTVPRPPRIGFDGAQSGLNTSIYTISLDGGELTRVTSGTGVDTRPTEFGGTVVYVSTMSGGRALFSVPVTGGSGVEIAGTGTSVDEPAFSPNGKRLAYVNTTSLPRVWIANPNGSGAARMSAADSGSGDQGNFTAAIEHRPSWSPKGNQIAYMSTRSGPAAIFTAPVAGAAGSATEVVGGSGLGNNVEPAWSPDGTELAFSSDRAGPTDVYVQVLSTGTVTRLTTVGNVGQPAWLPDGRLLFTQTTNGASALLWLDPSAPAVVHSISTGLMTAEHPAAAP